MRRRHLIGCLGLAGLPFSAAADLPLTPGRNVEISPTTLNLGGPGSTAICSIYNNGTVQTSSQVRLRAWTQVNGVDVLTDTNDVVASPPFITLQPATEQIVRIANLTAVTGTSELAYRLILNELPDAGSLTNNGIALLISFNLPVFVQGADALPPQLSASFVPAGSGADLLLRFRNDGDVHVRLADVAYAVGGQVCFKLPGLVGYVLPHSVRDVSISGGRSFAANGVLTCQTQLQAAPAPVQLG